MYFPCRANGLASILYRISSLTGLICGNSSLARDVFPGLAVLLVVCPELAVLLVFYAAVIQDLQSFLS